MPNLTPNNIDVFYGPSIHQSYDVYRHPVRDAGGNPVIVYRHGGGWASNDKRDLAYDAPPPDYNSANRFASYVFGLQGASDPHFDIISIETRQAKWLAEALGFSGGSPFGFRQPFDEPAFFPNAWDDAKLAIVHIKKNAKTYGINPNKMVVYGTSAGATIMWWSQLTAPLVDGAFDSRALAMICEKPLVDFRLGPDGLNAYSNKNLAGSDADNFYDYVFGTAYTNTTLPGAELPASLRQQASIAWYYETKQTQYAIPVLALAGPQSPPAAGANTNASANQALLNGFFTPWENGFDRVEIVGGPQPFTGATGMSPAAQFVGYLQRTVRNGVYSTSGGNTNGRTLTATLGSPALTLSSSTMNADGTEVTNASLSSYVHQDGDLLWIHNESPAGTAVLSQAGAGAYKILGKKGSTTIMLERMCRKVVTYPASGTIDATLYAKDFAASTPNLTIRKIPGKPYRDPHDPQQYASMESMFAAEDNSNGVYFLPYYQYDGDQILPFKDYRHTKALFDFCAAAVANKSTARPLTALGAAVI